MRKITSITRADCRDIGDDALAALKAVADRYGLTVERGTGNFSPDNFTAKFNFKVALPAGVASVEWKRYHAGLGFKEDDFGRSFTSGRDTYTICGVLPRATKNPILARRADGKVFKFRQTIVLLLLADAKRAAK